MPTPMSTRQAVMTPIMLAPRAPWPATACPNVATIIMSSSTPSSIRHNFSAQRGKRSTIRTLTHPLAPDFVSEPAEEELTDEGTDGRRDRDGELLVIRQTPIKVCACSVRGHPCP